MIKIPITYTSFQRMIEAMNLSEDIYGIQIDHFWFYPSLEISFTIKE